MLRLYEYVMMHFSRMSRTLALFIRLYFALNNHIYRITKTLNRFF